MTDLPNPPALLVTATPGHEARGAEIAARLRVPLVRSSSERAHRIEVGADGVSLSAPDRGAPLRADLVAAAASRSGRGAPLARAIGVGRGVDTVVDATAGLGRDAAALAAAGLSVAMVERHPVLAVLLEDALARARRDAPELAARLTFVHADAFDVLAHWSPPPDAVLIDPMFPDRGKTALPKRELALLRRLVPPDAGDALRLVELARSVATRRVVVKRPPRVAPLGTEKPLVSVVGPRVRFDVYAPRKATPT